MRASPLALLVVTAACGGRPCREPPRTVELGGLESPYDGYASPHYVDRANWLCRPDVDDDPCDQDLTSTEWRPDGSLVEVPHVVDDDPPFDCFYVYPTVTLSIGANIDGHPVAEGAVASTGYTQAARFSSVCRVFAPLYRQVTLNTYGARVDDDTKEACFDIATGDVKDAFLHFLGTESRGRPFAVIGHSQGTHHLMRVLTELVDDDPLLRERLVAALLIGGSVSVDGGGSTGGTFEHLPLCAADDDTGCVIAYRSIPVDVEPPAESAGAAALDDFHIDDGDALACTSPMGGREPISLRAVVRSSGVLLNGSALPDVETPWITLDGLYTATCQDFDGGPHLVVELAASDARGDPVGLRDDRNAGDLGLHVLDVQLALLDLVETVRVRAAAHGNSAP